MFSISAKDRCKTCHTERALRQCVRTKRGICWKCCNELRIDLKCPRECPYSPRFEEISPFPAFKADNNRESTQAMKYFIDIWITKVNALFEDKSPQLLATEDRDKVLEILSSYQYPGNFPVEYLMQKLELPYEQKDIHPYAEEIVAGYLDCIIAMEYNLLSNFTLNQSPLLDLEQRYNEIISSIPSFKKLKHYSFIHTGLSEDGSQCIVFIEINYKNEFCFILKEYESNWYIRQCIVGNPGLYFKLNSTFKSISQALAEAEEQLAYSEISEALRSFPDCADLYYYRGLYWLLCKNHAKAKVDFLDAVALDNYFAPPYMHLGILYLNEKEYHEAEYWFAALCKIEQDNMDAANNLGIALLAQGKKDEAINTWQSIVRKQPNYEMAKKNLELYG